MNETEGHLAGGLEVHGDELEGTRALAQAVALEEVAQVLEQAHVVEAPDAQPGRQ